ncbi:hypothetical protein D3C86_1955120 [compost metagenome]
MRLEDVCLGVTRGLVTQLLQGQNCLRQRPGQMLALNLRTHAELTHLECLLCNLHHLAKRRPRRGADAAQHFQR